MKNIFFCFEEFRIKHFLKNSIVFSLLGLILFVSLFLLIPYLKTLPWNTYSDIHALFYVFSCLLSLICAIIFLTRFFIFCQRLYLFFGLGFFIDASFLLGVALILLNKFPIFWKDSELLPVLLFSSRVIILIVFVLAIVFEDFFERHIESKKTLIWESSLTSVLALLVGFLTVYIFSLFPFPRTIYSCRLFTRPQDFVLSVSFLSLLPVYYNCYTRRRRDIFWWSLFIFIFLNFLSQLYISSSSRLFDSVFDIGLGMQILGYCALVIGISFESFILYRRQVKLSQDLSRANTELKKLDALKSKFISSVSHELRSPLGLIKESIDQLLEEIPGKLNPSQKHILDIARRNTSHLSELIEDILDLQRIEAGRISLKKEAADIRELLVSLYNSYKAICHKKGLEFILHLPPQGVFLYIDLRRFNQIIINLLSNAIKFTDKGFIKIEVDEQGAFTVVKIKDSGVGIKQEELLYIFDKFRQVGKSREGTGLGLAIVKELVKLHRGKVEVESVYGQGTEFRVYFPNLLHTDIYQEYIESLKQEAKLQDAYLLTIAPKNYLQDSDFVKIRKAFSSRISVLYAKLLRLGGSQEIFFIIKNIDPQEFLKILEREFNLEIKDFKYIGR